MEADSQIVEEVRKRAGEISRRYGDDLQQYIAHLEGVQRQHPERVVEQITVVPATPPQPQTRGA
ncbi:MAG: hypothetical protein U1D55_10805 [Phycisphaerae bacterium]